MRGDAEVTGRGSSLTEALRSIRRDDTVTILAFMLYIMLNLLSWYLVYDASRYRLVCGGGG